MGDHLREHALFLLGNQNATASLDTDSLIEIVNILEKRSGSSLGQNQQSQSHNSATGGGGGVISPTSQPSSSPSSVSAAAAASGGGAAGSQNNNNNTGGYRPVTPVSGFQDIYAQSFVGSSSSSSLQQQQQQNTNNTNNKHVQLPMIAGDDESLLNSPKVMGATSTLSFSQRSGGDLLPHAAPSKVVSSSSSSSSNAAAAAAATGGRRRAAVSEAVRNVDSNDLLAGFVPPVIEKDPDDLAEVRRQVAENHLFSSLDSDEKEVIVQAMDHQQFDAGMDILRQGEVNELNRFYVIISGTVSVIKGGSLVATMEEGKSFGELEMMYDTQEPCAATIHAVTDVVTYFLDRPTFKNIVLKATLEKRKTYLEVLENVPFLRGMSPYDKATLADVLQRADYEPDEPIIRFGERGSWMHIIVSGEVKVLGREAGRKKEIVRLKAGDPVGELEFLFNHAAVADVVAVSKVRTAKMNRKHFEMCMGPIADNLKLYIAEGNYEHFLKNADKSVLSDISAAEQKIKRTKVAGSGGNVIAAASIESKGEIVLLDDFTNVEQLTSGGSRPGTQGGGNTRGGNHNNDENNPAAVDDKNRNKFLYRFPLVAVHQQQTVMIGVRADGAILSWNEAAACLTNYSARDTLGQSIYSFIKRAEDQKQLHTLVEFAVHFAGNTESFFKEIRKSNRRRLKREARLAVGGGGGGGVGGGKNHLVNSLDYLHKNKSKKRRNQNNNNNNSENNINDNSSSGGGGAGSSSSAISSPSSGAIKSNNNNNNENDDEDEDDDDDDDDDNDNEENDEQHRQSRFSKGDGIEVDEFGVIKRSNFVLPSVSVVFSRRDGLTHSHVNLTCVPGVVAQPKHIPEMILLVGSEQKKKAAEKDVDYGEWLVEQIKDTILGGGAGAGGNTFNLQGDVSLATSQNNNNTLSAVRSFNASKNSYQATAASAAAAAAAASGGGSPIFTGTSAASPLGVVSTTSIEKLLQEYEVLKSRKADVEAMHAVNPRQLLGQVVSSLQHDAVERGTTVSTDFASNVPEQLFCDTELQKVFQKALHNCVKHVRDGKITINVSIVSDRSLEYLEIVFEDNGPGIPAAELRFLQKYYPAYATVKKTTSYITALSKTRHASTSSSSGSAAFAIEEEQAAAAAAERAAIRKKFPQNSPYADSNLFKLRYAAEKLGGTMEVESIPNLTKVTFRVQYLPVEEEDDYYSSGGMMSEEYSSSSVSATSSSSVVRSTSFSAASQLTEAAGGGGGGGEQDAADSAAIAAITKNMTYTTLVAEEQAVNRNALCSFLWNRKHAVVPANTPNDFMRLVESCDIIFVDPEQSIVQDGGNDVFSFLQRLERRKAIVVCGNNISEDIRRAHRRAGFITVSKPYSPVQTIAAIRQAEETVVKIKAEAEKVAQLRATFTKTNRGNWTKGRLLGKGAFGDVYEAIDDLTGGRMAVKMMKITKNQNKKELMNEVEVMCTLRHPNIIHYFYCEDVPAEEEEGLGRINIFMEYAGSGTLNSKLEKILEEREKQLKSASSSTTVVVRSKGMTVQEMRPILVDIIEGLKYIHGRRFVHCDLKTPNILFGNDSRAKIGDFGTARTLPHPNSQLFYMQGTMQYMAPEVMNADAELKKGYGFSADIWSIGCIAMELATGTSPWSHLPCRGKDYPLMIYMTELADRLEQVGPAAFNAAGYATTAGAAATAATYPSSGGGGGEIEGGEAGGDATPSTTQFELPSTTTASSPFAVAEAFGSLQPEQSINIKRQRGGQEVARINAATTNTDSESATPDLSNLFDEEAVAPAIFDFIRACLQLDPKKRPTAAGLLDFPLLREAFEDDDTAAALKSLQKAKFIHTLQQFVAFQTPPDSSLNLDNFASGPLAAIAKSKGEQGNNSGQLSASQASASAAAAAAGSSGQQQQEQKKNFWSDSDEEEGGDGQNNTQEEETPTSTGGPKEGRHFWSDSDEEGEKEQQQQQQEEKKEEERVEEQKQQENKQKEKGNFWSDTDEDNNQEEKEEKAPEDIDSTQVLPKMPNVENTIAAGSDSEPSSSANAFGSGVASQILPKPATANTILKEGGGVLEEGEGESSSSSSSHFRPVPPRSAGNSNMRAASSLSNASSITSVEKLTPHERAARETVAATAAASREVTASSMQIHDKLLALLSKVSELVPSQHQQKEQENEQKEKEEEKEGVPKIIDPLKEQYRASLPSEKSLSSSQFSSQESQPFVPQIADLLKSHVEQLDRFLRFLDKK